MLRKMVILFLFMSSPFAQGVTQNPSDDFFIELGSKENLRVSFRPNDGAYEAFTRVKDVGGDQVPALEMYNLDVLKKGIRVEYSSMECTKFNKQYLFKPARILIRYIDSLKKVLAFTPLQEPSSLAKVETDLTNNRVKIILEPEVDELNIDLKTPASVKIFSGESEDKFQGPYLIQHQKLKCGLNQFRIRAEDDDLYYAGVEKSFSVYANAKTIDAGIILSNEYKVRLNQEETNCVVDDITGLCTVPLEFKREKSKLVLENIFENTELMLAETAESKNNWNKLTDFYVLKSNTQYQLNLKKSGYYPIEKKFFIWEKDTTIRIDDWKPKSKETALLKSVLLPGWGQFYLDRPKAGRLHLLLNLGALSLTAYSLSQWLGANQAYTKAYSNYETQGWNPTLRTALKTESDTKFSKLESASSVLLYSLAALSLTWSWNLADILLYKPTSAK